MAIAWKAKWGQCNTGATAGGVLDVTQLNVTDETWFPVLTNLDLSYYPIIKSTGDEAAIAISDSMTPSDFSFLNFASPPYNAQADKAQMMLMLPFLHRQCPNLETLQSDSNTSTAWVFAYIPSLDRVIIFGGFNATRVCSISIYKYTTGQEVGSSSYIMRGLYARYENKARMPICYKYDGTEESLKNGNNYTVIEFTWASNPYFSANNIGTRDSAYNTIDGFVSALFGNYQPPDYVVPTNPYDPIDPSGPTDPDNPPGTFDDESDPIPDSPIPTLSSANTGFTRIYNPTLSQVQQLANYLWTDESVVQTIWNHIKQYFEDPMQAIIGFNLVPVPVPDGGTEEFKLMYIGTGVNMTVAASQFVDVDCGTLEVQPYYGSYLDYAPYTKISCFLPYIGNVEINPDEVMGTTIQVKYRVDICAGSCVAKILVDNNCLYQYSGHCAINIPFSSADFSTYVSAAISVAKLGVGVATAGALGAAGLEAGEIAQATSAVTTTKTERNPATGRQITSGTTTVTRESTRELKPSPASYAGLTPKNVSNTVGEVMGSKPGFQHSGSFSGNTGYLGVRRPFLIITRPNLCLPESYQAMNGFPAMITMKLSECTGFTQVQQVQFSGSSATNPEQDEILQFLKSGVVF